MPRSDWKIDKLNSVTLTLFFRFSWRCFQNSNSVTVLTIWFWYFFQIAFFSPKFFAPVKRSTKSPFNVDKHRRIKMNKQSCYRSLSLAPSPSMALSRFTLRLFMLSFGEIIYQIYMIIIILWIHFCHTPHFEYAWRLSYLHRVKQNSWTQMNKICEMQLANKTKQSVEL